MTLTSWVLMVAGASGQADAQYFETVGKVAESKSTPAVLTLKNGERLQLMAADPALADELKRLAGTKVKMTLIRSQTPSYVWVHDYRIIDVGNGITPIVGTLTRASIKGKSVSLLMEANGKVHVLPPNWGKKRKIPAGSKVWVVGKLQSDGVFKPRKFARLRLPASPE